MSWNCPYLKKDGSCKLRNQECEPLEKGCIILTNKKYKRLFHKPDDDIQAGKTNEGRDVARD